VALGPIPLRRQPGCLTALKKRLPASIGIDPGTPGVDILVCTDQTFGFDEYCGDVEDGSRYWRESFVSRCQTGEGTDT
jgi:hypothetical protein